MCGRFLYTMEIDEVVKSFKIELNLLNNNEAGEKFPGTFIPVILKKEGKICLETLYWGIKYKSSLIINSRFETVDEKPLFKNLLFTSRCIIPANSYYEWKASGKAKEKYEISIANASAISLGGIYGEFADTEGRFYQAVTILTIPASESLCHIHSRMPLIITEKLRNQWLSSDNAKIDKSLYLKENYAQPFTARSNSELEQISFL